MMEFEKIWSYSLLIPFCLSTTYTSQAHLQLLRKSKKHPIPDHLQDLKTVAGNLLDEDHCQTVRYSLLRFLSTLFPLQI